MVSKTIEEAKLRLKGALEGVESHLQTQLKIAEREILEAKTTKISCEKELSEMRQNVAREKIYREHAESLVAKIEPRLDEMSSEILNILKSAGAN